MDAYLHQWIDLENTTEVWDCEDCGKYFENDGSYQYDICPYCGSPNTSHEHINNKKWQEIKFKLDYEIHHEE
jgi:rubrerythrin